MSDFWDGVDLLFQAFFASYFQIIVNLNFKWKGFFNSP